MTDSTTAQGWMQKFNFNGAGKDPIQATVCASAAHHHAQLWTPTFGHLTVYCSPRVTLVHLVADAIPLGLGVTGQQVTQLLVHLGDCLVVSLLGFLEHLLSLLNLHLAGRNINAC
jgi:hypothetical protein